MFECREHAIYESRIACLPDVILFFLALITTFRHSKQHIDDKTDGNMHKHTHIHIQIDISEIV